MECLTIGGESSTNPGGVARSKLFDSVMVETSGHNSEPTPTGIHNGVNRNSSLSKPSVRRRERRREVNQPRPVTAIGVAGSS